MVINTDMKTKKYCVYKHTSLDSNKSYIGYTKHSITHRWNTHVNAANRGCYYHFARALRKYGTEGWKHEILFETNNMKYALYFKLGVPETFNLIKEFKKMKTKENKSCPV